MGSRAGRGPMMACAPGSDNGVRPGSRAERPSSRPARSHLQSTREGVIETVFLDWALALGSALLFGLAGRAEVRTADSLLRTKSFRWGLAYLHLGVLAISITLYA